MKKDFRHYEIICKSCNTLFYIDFKLDAGVYEFDLQRYGNTVIMRFTCSQCPFCMFDEDILRKEE